MKHRWLITLLIAFLVATNLVTAGLLLKAYRWDQTSLRNELFVQAISNGSMWAMNDFRSGKLRQLRLISVANGTIKDTGQRDGPFEIWTWIYVEGIPGNREAAEEFVGMYNGKMRYMHDHPDLFLKGGAHPLKEIEIRGIEGLLGFRLGTVLSVSGHIVTNSSGAKADADEPFLVRVENVNGKRLDSPVDYPARNFPLKDKIGELKIGDSFTCTGYETGGYNNYVDDPSGPVSAHPGYGFEVRFHVFKASKIV